MPSTKKTIDRTKFGAALARGTITVASATDLGFGALVAALTVLPEALNLALPHIAARKTREIHQWWDEVTMSSATTATEVRAKIDAKGDAAEEVIVLGLRRLLDSMTPEALVPLAILTRDYLRAGKTVDRFFRASSAILTESTRSEIEALRRLVTLALADLPVVNNDPTQPGDMIHLGVRQPDLERSSLLLKVTDATNLGLNEFRSVEIPTEIHDVHGIMQLAKNYSLASESPASWGPGAILIKRTDAERMRGLLTQ